MAANTPAKPGLIRNDPLADRPSPMKSILRTLPAWIASVGINAALIALFLLVVDDNTAEGENKKDKINPQMELVEDNKEVFNFDNIEIGDDPEREINYDMKRLSDVSVPGVEDPAEAEGIQNAPDNPPTSVPPPPGMDVGQGAAAELGPAGALPLGQTGGYMGNFKARPGGFAGRSGATRKKMVIEGGGNTESEAAVARGLRWLAFHQGKTRLKTGGVGGFWSLDKFPLHAHGPFQPGRSSGVGTHKNDVAGTAFGMLPFLAAGMTHKQGKWDKVVGAAAAWLIEKQDQKDGRYDRNMYAHGLATIAMAELYGLSADPLVRRSAQAAVNFIVYAQDPATGGWRYAPRQGGDTSVVGWQLMALKSAQMSGLNVPKQTLRATEQWLDSCESNSPLEIAQGPGNPSPSPKPNGKFGYTGPAGRPTMTAVGLLCRQYLGVQREHPSLLNGVCYLTALNTSTRVQNSYLNAVLPQLKTVGANVARQAKDIKTAYRVSPMAKHYGNMYFLYYATQIMHHMNNEFWDDWNLGIWVDPDGKQVRVAHLMRWDEDGDGLTKEELLLGSEGDDNLKELLSAEWDRVKRADKNSDGKLTEDELKDKSYLTWIPGMREMLIAHQEKRADSPHFGSWDPKGDRHSGAGGRIMKTSLCLLTLEVYYRHLPLYRRDIATGKGMKK